MLNAPRTGPGYKYKFYLAHAEIYNFSVVTCRGLCSNNICGPRKKKNRVGTEFISI